jgi:hypothetical protein
MWSSSLRKRGRIAVNDRAWLGFHSPRLPSSRTYRPASRGVRSGPCRPRELEGPWTDRPMGEPPKHSRVFAGAEHGLGFKRDHFPLATDIDKGVDDALR